MAFGNMRANSVRPCDVCYQGAARAQQPLPEFPHAMARRRSISVMARLT
jgi:hypothetical protein